MKKIITINIFIFMTSFIKSYSYEAIHQNQTLLEDIALIQKCYLYKTCSSQEKKMAHQAKKRLGKKASKAIIAGIILGGASYVGYKNLKKSKRKPPSIPIEPTESKIETTQPLNPDPSLNPVPTQDQKDSIIQKYIDQYTANKTLDANIQLVETNLTKKFGNNYRLVDEYSYPLDIDIQKETIKNAALLISLLNDNWAFDTQFQLNQMDIVRLFKEHNQSFITSTIAQDDIIGKDLVKKITNNQLEIQNADANFIDYKKHVTIKLKDASNATDSILFNSQRNQNRDLDSIMTFIETTKDQELIELFNAAPKKNNNSFKLKLQ